MNEMVERVASSLREELRRIGYGVGTINAGQLSDALARAAIEAMREPTAEMLLAGESVEGEEWSKGGDTVGKPYRAMIDAALK